MNLDKIKKIHFIGIGGIGVSALAKFLAEKGKIVSGSDMRSSEIVEEVEKIGIKVCIGHSPDNVVEDTDLVIYSPAAPDTNVERKKTNELGIKEMSYPEFLGYLSKDLFTIAVSGTNGKSTTTSMLGLILEKTKYDPTIIVGSKIKSFKYGNFKNGTTDYFLIEACEYKAAMLNLDPKIIVLTNIEEDHLDYYKDLDHIKNTFKEYIDKVENDGMLVYNADDKATMDIVEGFKGKKINYAIENNADVMAKNIKIKNCSQIFDVYFKGDKLGEIELKAPGKYNVYNALGAIAASLHLGVNFEIIKKVLSQFKGIWRRFEIINDKNGITVISDYAHHPTAVKNTIQAAKDFFAGRRIVAIFQPHSHHRTKRLFAEFTQSFDGADIAILSEIYDVAGRENPKDKISSNELAEAIIKRGKKDIFFAENLDKCQEIAQNNIKKGDVVLVMGAGDIYKLVSKINYDLWS